MRDRPKLWFAIAWLAASACGRGAPPPTQPPPAGPTFVDATDDAGIDYVNLCGAPPDEKGWLTETMGAGAAWLDFDLDGRLDLYVVNGSAYGRAPGHGEPNRLYRQTGGGRFEPVPHAAGADDRGWGHGVAVGDFDNDGDPDLYVTNLGPNVLYRNDGDGQFSEITAAAGVGDPSWSTGAAFLDLDGDGDLDLYVANYVDFDREHVPRGGSDEALSRSTCTVQGVPVFCGPAGLPPAADRVYRNDGGGRFREATAEFGMVLETPRYALGLVSGDFDNDGDPDLYVANDSVRNVLWRNDRTDGFREVAVGTMTALSGAGREQAGMGVDFGDYDGDGWLDLIVTNFSHDLNTLYRNVEGRFFTDESVAAGLGVTRMALSWGTGFADFDLDGDLDLFVANGHLYPVLDRYDNGLDFRQRNHLFVNEQGRFEERSSQAGPGFEPIRSFRGAALADYDGDGDVDLFVTALGERGLLLRNDTPRRFRWLEVALRARSGNRDAVGARVTVRAGGRRWIRERKAGGSYLSQAGPDLHFGLGPLTSVDAVEVRWPGGRTSEHRVPALDRRIVLVEPDPL